MNPKWLNAYEPGIFAHPEYPDLTLPEILRDIAGRYPAHPALIYQDRIWSYQQFNELVSQMAHLLIGTGLKPGERVGVHLVNSPQFVIAYYGLLRAGAVAVPINPHSFGDDFHFIVRNCSLRALVTSHAALAGLKLEQYTDLTVVVTDVQTPLDPAQNYPLDAPASVIRLEQALFGQPVSDPMIPIHPDDYANLQYTGGTTGRSKGAILSHRNLVANAVQIRHWFKHVYQDGEGRFLSVIPYFHIYGLTTSMNFPVISASAMLLHSKFDLPELIQSIEKHKPNLYMGVPAMYGAFIIRQEHPDLSSIKACMSGSATLPLAVQTRFEQLTGGKLVEGYGLSEASPAVCCNPVYGVVKNGSIGVPLPGTEIKVVDPQTGAEITNPHEVGELLVKGPQVMQGYWNQPEETAQTLQNGWLHTGDLVRVDEDGYVYIADRLKDMIISGGDKIYPREVEDLLYTHPAVKEAAVIGVPHPLRGEVAKAFVVLKPESAVTEREVKQFCAEHLTKYKVPHQVQFVEALPRNSVGKILKQKLREIA